MRRTTWFLASASVIILLFAASEPQAHPHGTEPILLGVSPQQDPARVFAMWQPVIRYLEREVGHAFAFESAPSIEEFQKRVLEGRYDIWWGNPLTYIQANKRIGYVPIARDTIRIAGLLVTRKEDGIKSAKELLGKKIAYPAPDALGATLLVQDYLARADVAPTQVEAIYTGTMDSGLRGLLEGRVMAAGVVPRAFSSLDVAERDKLSILAKTEEVAPQPIVVHPRLYKNVVTQIQRALLKLNWTPEGQQILASILYKEIVVSNDLDYDIHREVARRLKIPF